jgi:hypothetical protein
LENTDHRPFTSSKKNVNFDNKDESDGPDKHDDDSNNIDQTIAYFKINNNFMIEKFYKEDYKPPEYSVDSSDSETIAAENETSNFKWSFDISNMQEMNDSETFSILIAISYIDVDKDMRQTEKKEDYNKKLDYKREFLSRKRFKCLSRELDENNDEFDDYTINMTQRSISENFNSLNDDTTKHTKKGVAIYRIELEKEIREDRKEIYFLSAVTCHYTNKISGICRFIEVGVDSKSLNDSAEQKKIVNNIEVSNKDNSKSLIDYQLKRFIILNFHGIYNFEFNERFDFFNLNEKFKYPTSIRRELDNWFAEKDDCMKRLLSCIYDKYFLVTQYKNDVQSLEGKA